MYKLLLVTDQPDIQENFAHEIDWPSYGCNAPVIVSTAEQAIAHIEAHPLDAVGYYLGKRGAIDLTRYLHIQRPSLPIFSVTRRLSNQIKLIKELVGLLNRFHADDADEPYDEATMLAAVRDDYTHRLLSGEIRDEAFLKRGLELLRMDVSADRRCVLYELSVPLGENYVSVHSANAQERLERALRNSFIGRQVGDAFYGVAVLTPRRIRVVAAPLTDELSEDIEKFAEIADGHVLDGIAMVKEYLDLEIVISESGLLDSLLYFVKQPENT